MQLRIKNKQFPENRTAITQLPDGLLLISTINAHSYNVAQHDEEFAEALLKSDVLLPDGASIVKAVKWLRSEKIERIAGWDLFVWEMQRLQIMNNGQQKKVLFLGSSDEVLEKIKIRASVDYPNLEIHTYSPPYKPEFSEEDNLRMINIINTVQPDLLWIGMTAPKQEKWAYKLVYSNDFTENYKIDSNYKLNCHIGCIGAVFDFYAGTVERAPIWWQRNSLEWLYRLIKEPRRMWRRYLIGNTKFLVYILREKFF